MRSLTRLLLARATVVGSCFALWAGCSAKQQTEYVTGISTQVTVPRDLKSVLVEVAISGVQQFCRAYRVYDGKVQLPRSLGTFAQNGTGSGPVTYTIIGIGEEYSDSSPNPLFDGTCTNLTIGQNSARILRRSRQPYVPEQILFLPLPLKYSCVDKNCGDEETCKGGKCVSATVADPEKTFPRYTPDLADGTGGTCFHANTFKAPDGTTDIPGCMTGALPAIPVDATKCIYAVPGKDAPLPLDFPGNSNPYTAVPATEGINVQVTFDGIVKEILDSDIDEGFFIPDPVNHPQQFQLASGLCDMVKGTNGALHAISDIRTSGTCQGKKLAQPLCAADALAAMGVDPSGVTPTPAPAPICQNVQLKPQPSSLMLVIDDSANGATFFKALQGQQNPDAPEDSVVGAAVSAAFSAPSLSNTTLGAFYTTTGDSGTCNATAPADVAPFLVTADNVAPTFQTISQHATTAGTDSDIEAGLKRAYLELAKPAYANDVRRGVVVFSNHFDDGVCLDKATDLANAVKGTISTYAMQVVKLPDTGKPTVPGSKADELSIAGGTYPAAYQVGGDFGAANKFKSILHDFTTCSYVIPTPTPAVDAGAQLVYADVETGLPLTDDKLPKFDAACTSRDVAGSNGFGTVSKGDTTEVYLCGTACTDYQAQLDKALLLGTSFGKPAPAIPIYLRRSVCTTP